MEGGLASQSKRYTGSIFLRLEDQIVTNLYRKIGFNVHTVMQKEKVFPEELASAMSYSLKDIWNVIEGKVMLPPAEIKRVASVLGVSVEELVDREPSVSLPDKVLDLIDEYIEIRESIGIG